MPFFGGGSGDYHIIVTNIKGGTDAAPATTGSNNMALGNGALQNLIVGDDNIAIGNNAGQAINNSGHTVIIGAHSLAGSAKMTSIDNAVVIGDHIGDYFTAASHIVRSIVIAGTENATNVNGAMAIDNSIYIHIPTHFDDFITNATMNNSILVGSVRTQDPGVGSNLVNTVLVGSGSVFLGGAASNSVIVGNGNGNVAGHCTNMIVIGHDINVPDVANSIIIGDSSYTSVTIGGVALSSATGANFPDGAIIGNPGTEGAGITIGGTLYNSTLKVSDIGGANIAQSILHRHSTTREPITVTARSNSDTNAHGVVVNGMPLHTHYAAGWTGTEYNIFGSIQIAADAAGAISDTSSPGDIIFSTTPNGAILPQEAMRVNSSKAVSFAGAFGTAGQILSSGGNAAPPSWITAPGITIGALIGLGGTSTDLTGIPATAKKVTLSFYAVSTSGTNSILVLIGTSSGFLTSGYNSVSSKSTGATVNVAVSTAGIAIPVNAAVSAIYGTIEFTRVDSSNMWVYNGSVSDTAGGMLIAICGGMGSLANPFNSIRLTTVGGTDTFDGGFGNLSYQ